MYINNTYINLENEEMDINKYPNYYEENEFISNLMLNPQKYRDFKRNINRINNIDNEINYLKSIEKSSQINFLDNIIISEEEYHNALKDEEIIFENLTEERINDLLSHKKLLSHEKHLIETMSYILGYESFDWNMFRKIINLYDLKTKMQNINYSRLKKRRINILLGQLCRSDKFNKFLNMNDFCDSGLEFVYEWIKAQLKIFFYLYQNKKLMKTQNSKSSINLIEYNTYDGSNKIDNNINNDLNNNNVNNIDPKMKDESIQNITEENDNCTITSNINYQKNIKINESSKKITNKSNNIPKAEKMDSVLFKNSTGVETNMNNINNSSNISLNNNKSSLLNNNTNIFMNRSSSLNHIQRGNTINKNRSTILLTSLPYIGQSKNQTNEQSTAFGSYCKINTLNNSSRKNTYLKEAKKVSFKLRGFNKEKEKMLKEIRTAEMLPLLKNKTFPQMRNYFDDKVPFSKEIKEKAKMDICYASLNGAPDEKKMLSLIACGKIKTFNLESLFKLKNILQN